MLTIARVFLALMAAVFIVMGVTALVAPASLAEKLALAPQAVKGLAELRGLYGGLFVSWGVVMLLSIRATVVADGLLIGMAIMMGAIAAARMVSLAIDHEPGFNVPAAIAEGLIALVSWFVYSKRRSVPAAAVMA